MVFFIKVRCYYRLNKNEGQVAQVVEQRTENPRVGGSTPPLPSH